MARTGQRAAREAVRSLPVETLARFGLFCYGAVHLLIALLTARVAFGRPGTADKSGALALIAQRPGGRLLLWVVVAGLAALTLWQVGEAVWHRHPRHRHWQRVGHATKAAVFAALAFAAAKVADGGGSGKREQVALTARLLGTQAGRVAVAAAGVAVVAVAAVLVWRGAARRFRDDLDLSGANPAARRSAVRFGVVGHIALGIAYGATGALVVAAAVTADPTKAVGPDVALHTLATRTYGDVLLLVVAAGIACYGLYCLADARYRRAECGRQQAGPRVGELSAGTPKRRRGWSPDAAAGGSSACDVVVSRLCRC